MTPAAQVQPHLPRPEPGDQLLSLAFSEHYLDQLRVADLLPGGTPRASVVEGGRGDLDPVLTEHSADGSTPNSTLWSSM
jgi:hypothetical protein